MLEQQVNHNSTTTNDAIEGASGGFMDNFRVSGKIKWLRSLLKVLLFCLFIYLWSYWATMMIFFRDENIVYLSDYLITLPFNLGLFIPLFRVNKVVKIMTLMIILFTIYMYSTTLFFGKAWEFAVVGLLANFLAAILLLSSRRKKNNAKNSF